MNKIYYLSTCDTCKRIMKETGVEGFELIDIKFQSIDPNDLDAAQSQLGSYEALLNKRAVKYRQDGLHLRTLNESEVRQVILSEYTLLKRPLYLIDGRAFAGNSKQTVEAIKQAIRE
jgi:arsenate reductase